MDGGSNQCVIESRLFFFLFAQESSTAPTERRRGRRKKLSRGEGTVSSSRGLEAGAVVMTQNVTTTTATSSSSFLSLVAMGVGLYSLSLVTCVGNAMVLYAIRTEKRLQTVSNMFIMSLALADFTVGCFVMPISSAKALTGDDWPFGYVLCQIWLSVDYTASTASIFNLSILSVDRYWSITSPLRYLRRRTKKRALIMIALAWTGASMWVIPVLGWHHFIPDGVRQQPEGVCDTEFASNVTFKVVTSILNFYIPTSCIVVLYVRIFLAIRRRSRDIERLGGQTSTPRQHDHNSCSTLRTVGTAAETTTFGGGDSLSSSDGEDDEEDEDEEENGFVVSVEFGRLAVLAIHDAHYHKEGALQSLTLFEDVNVRVQYESGDNSREKQHSYGCCGCGNSKGSKKTPSPVNVSRQPLDRSDKVVRDSGHSRHLHCYRSSKPSKQADSPSTPFCLNIGTKEAQGREPRSVRWWCCRSSAPRAASASSSSSAPRLRVHQHNPNVVLAKEKKAARQLGVIVGAFILCWLPYFTLFIVVSYCKECVDQTLFDTSVWFGYFNSSLNPILYPLCNANFKRAFKRMLMQLPLLHIRTQAREQGHRERKSKKKHPVAIDARDECNQT